MKNCMDRYIFRIAKNTHHDPSIQLLRNHSGRAGSRRAVYPKRVEGELKTIVVEKNIALVSECRYNNGH